MEVDCNTFTTSFVPNELWLHIGQYATADDLGRLRLVNGHFCEIFSYRDIGKKYPNYHRRTDKRVLQQLNRLQRFYSRINMSDRMLLAFSSKVNIIHIDQAGRTVITGPFKDLTYLLLDSFTGQDCDPSMLPITTSSTRLLNTLKHNQRVYHLLAEDKELQLWHLKSKGSVCVWKDTSDTFPDTAALVSVKADIYVSCTGPSLTKQAEMFYLKKSECKQKQFVTVRRAFHHSPISDHRCIGKHLALISPKGIEFVNQDPLDDPPFLDWSTHNRNEQVHFEAAYHHETNDKSEYWVSFSNEIGLFFAQLVDNIEKNPIGNTKIWKITCLLRENVFATQLIQNPKITKFFWVIKQKAFHLCSFNANSPEIGSKDLRFDELPINRGHWIRGLASLNLGLKQTLCLLVERPRDHRFIARYSQKFSVLFMDPESHTLIHDQPFDLFKAFKNREYDVRNFLAVERRNDAALILQLQNRYKNDWRLISVTVSGLTSKI